MEYDTPISREESPARSQKGGMHSKPKRGPKLIFVILADLVFGLAVLSGWLLWKSASTSIARNNYYKNAAAAQESAAVAEESSATLEAELEPEPEAAPAEEETVPEPETEAGAEAEAEVEAEPEAEPEPDNRTEWQIKFADHFSDTVIQDENTYISPNISITTTEHVFTNESGKTTTYYVADIYISCIECFQTFFRDGTEYPSGTTQIYNLAEQSGSILAINGDYCGYSYGGVVIRNGIQAMYKPNGSDVCVLLWDGTMYCTTSEDYAYNPVDADTLYQVWTFGPMLLDSEGNARPNSELRHNAGASVTAENPRTGIGYYEPGHYCFFVSDGRSDTDVGLTLGEMSQIFAELGCKAAYNMDGGASSLMYLNGAFVNKPQANGERDIPDIILIADIDPESLTEEEPAESEELP